MLFSDINGISKETILALKDLAITNPTDIQKEVIPRVFKDKDSHILAQAATGSGKTLAFSIPVIEQIDAAKYKVQAVILSPTRELAKQIHETIKQITKYKKIKSVSIYGGVSISPQIEKIRKGAQIVIATPGRLMDIYNQGAINFEHVKFVVLDEADRMLDMGFLPDIEFLLLNAMRNIHPRLFCFSATMLEQINDLSERFTDNKNVIKINVSQDSLTVDNCDQYYYLIENYSDKYYHFVRILRLERPKHAIIFVNTKKTAQWLFNRLKNEKNLRLKMDLIMGDLSQKQRENVINKFKEKKINCLIATDVAARGLDIPNITHVFNYDIPEYEEMYVHRIGRTARMSSEKGEIMKGTAITLVLKDQFHFLSRIEGYQDKEIKRRPLPPRNLSRSKGYPGRNKSKYIGPGMKGKNIGRAAYPKTEYTMSANKKSRRNFFY